MQSMTGFGRAEGALGDVALAVEINSVNRRNFELNCHLPRDWASLERPAAEKLRKQLSRGKVTLAVRFERSSSESSLSWDAAQIRETVARLGDLANAAGVRFEPDADFLLRLVQTLSGNAHLPDAETAWTALEPVVDEALAAHVAMRKTEGAVLASDLTARLEALRQNVQSLAACTAGAVLDYREKLFARLQKAGLELDLDDDRVLKEIALFADRIDVTEELTRLGSHFDQFAEILEADEAAGRKLDFLCQEINREFNTIGSKTNLIEATRTVIDSKNELERIREQVQNLE
ncbi:MAG: YicC/YloC family endoribonuclease [Opitutales bacterium]